VYVRLKSATSATSLRLKDLILNKIRNKVQQSATWLMAKDLGMATFWQPRDKIQFIIDNQRLKKGLCLAQSTQRSLSSVAEGPLH